MRYAARAGAAHISDWSRIRNWNSADNSPRERMPQPKGLTDWDVRFLQQIARYPLPLSEAQRAVLRWIAERAA